MDQFRVVRGAAFRGWLKRSKQTRKRPCRHWPVDIIQFRELKMVVTVSSKSYDGASD